jgi:thiol-disulfide isomerase/thioredoxin
VRLFATLLFAAPFLCSADSAQLCSGSADARRALSEWKTKRSDADSATNSFGIDRLAKQYPKAVDVQLARMDHYRWFVPAKWPAVRDEFVQAGEANPEDALALTLAGSALEGKQTPRSLELLARAMKLQPGYPIAALKLAEIYQRGRFEDKEKAKSNFEIYLSGCSAYTSGRAAWTMGKLGTPAAQAASAKALRARLEQESEPDEMSAYEQLWGLEFRTTPPQDHPALRKRVAADLDRLAKLNPKPNAAYLWMLRNGAKQAEASTAQIDAMAERILKEFPSSREAFGLTMERWRKEVPEPRDHKDKAAWDTWNKTYAAAMKEWVPRFTQLSMKSRAIYAASGAQLIERKDAAALGQEIIEEARVKGDLDSSNFIGAASLFVDRRWPDAKALEWLEEGWRRAEAEDQRRLEDDTETDEDQKTLRVEGDQRRWAAMAYLEGLVLAGGGKVPNSLREFVTGPPPAKKKREAGYYQNLAMLAQCEGRKSDALAYYQAALFAREKAPDAWRGAVRDQLLESAKALFMSNGGTEAAFAFWSTPRGEAKKPELSQGRWEKPTKKLPAFELSDLSGKTWKLKQLEGRSVLINLWATWCGPCRAELPHFQELYEKTRERSDVQVITFNIDEELGLVAPFMKENKFTFPVLLAYGFTRELLDGIGIPQNWLIDAKGNWLWTQMGFDASDADWVNTMVKKLELARQSQ